MGHSPSRSNGAGNPLPSRFARFRRRLRLHRRRRSGDDSASARNIAADEFAGIARIRIVKADMQFKDKFFACLSLGERTYRTDKSDNTQRPVWDSEKKVIVETNGPHIARISVFETNRFSKNTLVGYCEVDLFEMLTKDLEEHSEDLPLLDPSSSNATVGSITISCYIEDPVETEQSFARRVLAIVDYDENGTLSLSEFSDLMKAFGNKLAVAKVRMHSISFESMFLVLVFSPYC
jgi:phosphatidylserine decarboxylase